MPEARDARRLIPDPDNEPDFYTISKVFPVRLSKPAIVPHHQQQQQQTQLLGSTLVGAPRLTSDISWMDSAMPLAKRQRQFLLPAMQAVPPQFSGWGGVSSPLQAGNSLLGNSLLVGEPQQEQANSSALAIASLRAQIARAQLLQQQQVAAAPPAASMNIGDWLRSQR
jgi:hypothetical protein